MTYAPWDIRAYEYTLPQERIAHHPVTPRDSSRLLCYARDTGVITHRIFHDICTCLQPHDILVCNDCRVFPARLYATRTDTGTRIELLLVEEIAKGQWKVMVRPGRSCAPGVDLCIAPEVYAHIDARHADGTRSISFRSPYPDIDTLCEKHGDVPLPPYITRESRAEPEDTQRYQTVYARDGHAVAAPTAGLHFTHELLTSIQAYGCQIVYITLHVGPGTFLPVKDDDIRHHVMHTERFCLSEETAEQLNHARAAGGRIIAVGTTVVRTLETCVSADGIFTPHRGATDIFIYPPHTLKGIDGMITNFHLPRSTLLMLIAAWVGDDWRRIYEEAIAKKYRFYSYGDAMLLV